MSAGSEAHRLVLKVGTSSLTYPNGKLNIRCIESLVRVISDLHNCGFEIVLVSSGAVGVGVSKLGLLARPADIRMKQAAAAVGQCELMHIYDKMFLEYGVSIVLTAMGLDTPSLNYEIQRDIPTTAMDLFSSVILAPIAEELLYRGIVLKETAKVSRRFAIVFSAVMFGLMHGNPYQLVMATLLGLVLGYVTIESDSLIPAIVCHMAVNFAASIPDLASYFDEALYDPVYYIISALEFVLGLIGSIYIIKNDGIKLPPYTEYHKKRTLPIMITSAGIIIITAIYVFDVCTSVEPIEEAADFAETALRMFIR